MDRPGSDEQPVAATSKLATGRVIDFRHSGWGHAMHGWTWKVIEPRYVVTDGFWKRTTTQHPRVSVMVHTPRIREGDTVIYTGQSGNDREATVAEVHPCWEPRDMFTLILEDIREHSPADATRSVVTATGGELGPGKPSSLPLDREPLT